MNAAFLSTLSAKRRKAMALIMVVTTVALMSILVVAIFSITRTEYKSTLAYVAGKSAKQLGDMGVAIVEAQIQNAQNTESSASGGTTHATQPGMVRVYKPDGSFSSAYKLYSSTAMKVSGSESALYSAQNIPPSDWNTFPARYVDLNEPVVRPSLSASSGSGSGSSSQYAVYFPIIDPRAAWNYGSGGQSAGISGKTGTTQVEGFSFAKIGKDPTDSSDVDQALSVSNADDLRLPMPVEWLYVLQDGTVGVLDSSNKFITSTLSGGSSSSGAGVPSIDNPIVGRVAFWTDDESCKININTASEPTYQGTPFYYHDRDAKWAYFPPVTGEYQRYPGHPATVALSSVLAPNYLLDPWMPSLDGLSSMMQVVNLKEQIYDFAPKVMRGGSEAGTRPFAQDELSSRNGERNSSTRMDLSTVSDERLFTSVDEMLFKEQDFDSTNGRAPAVLTFPTGSFFNHDALERSRFFLTAHSRSPEFNIHGLPRVCIWPVADESLGQDYRTTFDNMIALCATIKKNSSNPVLRSYYFRRANSRSSSYDVGLSRNSSLLDYLVNQMTKLTWPQTSFASSATSSDFGGKYGTDNVNQLAVQFFDYIRTTNLYDGIMVRNNAAAWNGTQGSGTSGTNGTYQKSFDLSGKGKLYSFTSQRISPGPNSADVTGDNASNSNQATSASGILPRHGQVSPSIWSNGGRSYKGFGRFITLSEIGFQFICTASGQSQAASSLLTTWPKANVNFGTGGDAAIRYKNGANTGQDTVTDTYGNVIRVPGAYWWSNFPPLSDADIPTAMANYGCEAGGKSANALYHPSKHPGFVPANWNMTLPRGVWLTPAQKRIQVMLMLEAFCPSLGYTGLYPEFTIVLDGSTIAQMKVNGQSLFNTTGDVPIKSDGNIYNSGSISGRIVGGHAGPTAFAGGRHTRGISQGGGTVLLVKDSLYDTNNTSGHNALQNFAFCSDFITVPASGTISVDYPRSPVKVQIYDTHDWESAQPVQTLNVDFSQLPAAVPVPNLCKGDSYGETTDRFGRTVYTRARQGPHFWVANHEGCIGRMQGQVNPQYGSSASAAFWSQSPTPVNPANTNLTQAVRGRLDTSGALVADARANASPTDLSVMAPDATDVVRSIIPALGDYRVLAAKYNVPSSWWRVHPHSSSQTLFQAHSFTGYTATSEVGTRIAMNDGGNYDGRLQLIGGARFDLNALGAQFNGLHSRQGDLPPDSDSASAANAFGDFDTGVGTAREGPYINKPDEGNFYVGNETAGSQTKYWRSGYFYYTERNADDWRSGLFMTPNRMISSPVMFGSLPTGVWGNKGGLPSAPGTGSMGSEAPAVWQTLLFRPHAQVTTEVPNSQNSHPGMQDPSDHYLLDLFFMPIVEPYAISEPLSIAGRVNMNYQIMPFTHIRRATGLHAVLKGEYMTAIPNNQITAAKENVPASSGTAGWDMRFNDDKNDKRYWHRPIDARATLRQFDLKFAHKSGGQKNYQGLFRSASQICEMHLIPRTLPAGQGISSVDSNIANANSQAQINAEMNTFWAYNRPTGDNVRERPYSNLYARLTTRSNTFRVHVRAQVVKKARSTTADTFDPAKDAVISEYRGSTLIERYIDPNDTTQNIPDYASSGISQTPLDSFYRFRSLETKRFNP